MARDNTILPQSEVDETRAKLRRGIERSRAMLNDYRNRLFVLREERIAGSANDRHRNKAP